MLARPILIAVALALATSAAAGPAAPAAPAPSAPAITHAGTGHDVHVSTPALAVDATGPIVAWLAREGHANRLLITRPGTAGAPVRVNPADLEPDALHQPPGLAVGPGGEVYVSWSSGRPRPPGVLFASDLRISRSLDGGTTFEPPLQVNDDRPMSHSFEGLASAPDGTLLVAWVDGRDGTPRTYLARVTERGSRVESVRQLDGEETCVCCRIDVAAGGETVAVLWRKVFPGSVRDMVLGVSADGARSFAPAARVHTDGWKISACPHRGGSVAMDRRGAVAAAWYTEGATGQPRILFALAPDGRRFGTPRRLDSSSGSIPDHVRLAMDGRGGGAVVWEDATAVRRRILARTTRDGGRSFTPVRILSTAVKAWGPDLVADPAGGFVVVWQEERFPAVATVVHRLPG